MQLVIALAILLLTTTATAQTWRDITPAPGDAPTPRRYAGAVHDPVADRMIVFGGQAASGMLDDVWSFDLATETWTELTPASNPAARRTPSVIYDPVGHRMVMWAGQAGSTFFDDVWAFDLTDHTWSEYTPANPIPARRYGVVSIYDPVAATLVTFGGFTFQGRFDDTWRFDPVAGEWTEIVTPTAPLRRCLHAASYDARDHRLIMYGGQNNGPLDDLWALDLTTGTWNELTPAVRPSGRFFVSHVYDATNHRTVVFGGTRGANGGITDEVWTFDLDAGEWIAMETVGTPGAREGAPAIYLEDEDRMIVFGGHDGSYLNDVWSLDDLSGTSTSAPSSGLARARLLPNRPNPFNPRTTIDFVLDAPAAVTLEIVDMRGRRVRTLASDAIDGGEHSIVWDGADDAGNAVSSGVYRVELRVGQERRTRLVTLAK